MGSAKGDLHLFKLWQKIFSFLVAMFKHPADQLFFVCCERTIHFNFPIKLFARRTHTRSRLRWNAGA